MAASLIDSIVNVLDGTPGYAGTTYNASEGTKFTLLDTPGLWGIKPNDDSYIKTPSAACQKLLTTITDVIAAAEQLVDISMLWEEKVGLPQGLFQSAIRDGFSKLNASGKTPLVRIIVGIAVAGPPRELENWVKAIIPDYQHVKYPVYIATNSTSGTSFNHSKIVASDGRRAIVGGHNLWQDDYLGFGPVHDVSGLFEGPAAYSAHAFLDKLWELPHTAILLAKGVFKVVSGGGRGIGRKKTLAPGPAVGNARALALGRLGSGLGPFNMASNASVTARVLALCSATSRIRMSQQTLQGPQLPALGYDFYTCLALVRAIREGVQVEIVVSNEEGNYHGHVDTVLTHLTTMYFVDKMGKYDGLHVPPRTDLKGWAALSTQEPFPLGGPPPAIDPNTWARWATEVREKLFVCTLAFSDNGAYQWLSAGKTKNAINHAKVYIVDDRAFYVGSDNMYLSFTKQGLQEFGFLIENAAETQSFIDNYWNKLWKYSQVRRALPAVGVGA